MDCSNPQKWEEMASLLRTIGHPIRLTILDELCLGAKCVSDVQEMLDVSQSNLSQHLHALKQAGLIDSHTNGPLRCYYLIRPTLVKKLLQVLAKDHPTKPRPKQSVLREVAQHQKNKSLSA